MTDEVMRQVPERDLFAIVATLDLIGKAVAAGRIEGSDGEEAWLLAHAAAIAAHARTEWNIPEPEMSFAITCGPYGGTA